MSHLNNCLSYLDRCNSAKQLGQLDLTEAGVAAIIWLTSLLELNPLEYLRLKTLQELYLVLYNLIFFATRKSYLE